MKLSAHKTLELVFSSAKKPAQVRSVAINGRQIAQVTSAKLLGVTLSVDLKWDIHIVVEADQRVFMLCQLKKGGVGAAGLIRIYESTIRPILEYACQVWHSALTVKLTKDPECVQKRALRIASMGPGDHCQHLARPGLPRLTCPAGDRSCAGSSIQR